MDQPGKLAEVLVATQEVRHAKHPLDLIAGAHGGASRPGWRVGFRRLGLPPELLLLWQPARVSSRHRHAQRGERRAALRCYQRWDVDQLEHDAIYDRQ